MNDIREQIEWCKNNGGFVGRDLADTMEKLLAVYEAAEAFLQSADKQGKFSTEYQWTLEEAVNDTNIHR